MRLPLILLSASATLGLSCAAQAAAPADQVAKLGKSLTHLGAEQAANADGSIPAYTGATLRCQLALLAAIACGQIRMPMRSLRS